ncbi:MAG TPA: hypothetical protein VKU38_08960, partial [Ktedonobacteraceae bacterium]|nr:hypothetical protein [Ktedonobacteraceae bacterium]
TMEEQLEDIAATKLQEAQAANDRLEEAKRMDKQQRAAKAEQLQGQLFEWEQLSTSIHAIMSDLKLMDQALKAPTGSQA